MADDLHVSLDGLALEGEYSGATLTLESFDGWGKPGTTASPQQRARANGAWLGDSWYGPRFLALGGKITAATVEAARDLRDELMSHVGVEDVTLEVTEGDLVRSCTVRQSPAEVLAPYLSGHGNNLGWSIQLVATDPRKTSADLTGSTGLPSSTGGLTLPAVLPFEISAVSTSGRIELTNDGNVAGHVSLRITAGVGGITGPSVTHVSSGRTLEFATSLTIPEGNSVDVDMEAHTVLENGTAARNGWVTSRGWSGFEPGVNEWVFGATSGVGTLEVTATPSWM